MQSRLAEFHRVFDAYQSRLVHNAKPVWICKYGAIPNVRFKFFQVYYAVEPCPRGRMPWTVNNRRIGQPDRGFATLSQAIDAAKAA